MCKYVDIEQKKKKKKEVKKVGFVRFSHRLVVSETQKVFLTLSVTLAKHMSFFF